jgi:multidrug efflux pump subunit AcrB
VFSTYTASNPSIYLDIDREKAQALGLGMNDVFAALQATLGGIYINNFNLFGRIWQVNIEGEAADRNDVASLWQIYVRNKYGDAVPLRSMPMPASWSGRRSSRGTTTTARSRSRAARRRALPRVPRLRPWEMSPR